MKTITGDSGTLAAIFTRRSIKSFDPVTIPPMLRERLLDAARVAPSSFNSQPYHFYWIESAAQRAAAARLCLGQDPATTASVLVVVAVDIGSLRKTSQLQLEWMGQAGFPEEQIRDYARTAKIGRFIFMPGPFGLFGLLKWPFFRAVHLWKVSGMPPIFRQGLFKWATKSTALACQNLMLAAESLGLNTCPMEGFDGARLSKFLGLSSRYHEIVMVIAIGKKSPAYKERPQWRRPIEASVTIL